MSWFCYTICIPMGSYLFIDYNRFLYFARSARGTYC